MGRAHGASLGSSICARLILVIVSMRAQVPELQARRGSMAWVGSYAISYDMGVDGVNALLVLLVSILFPILIAAEWNRKNGVRGIHGLFLVLQTSFFGSGLRAGHLPAILFLGAQRAALLLPDRDLGRRGPGERGLPLDRGRARWATRCSSARSC